MIWEAHVSQLWKFWGRRRHERLHAVGGMAVDAVHTTIDWAGHQSVRVFAHTIVTAEIIGDRFLGANAFSWPR